MIKKTINKETANYYSIIHLLPPYSTNIKTNIGKTLLNLIKKHFPKTNKLHRIFKKNTVKISYSCMSKISSIILGHNKNLLNQTVTQYGCNCRIRKDFPLQISASHKILFIELMSIARQTKIISFILG